LIADLQLDILEPVIDGIEDVYFADPLDVEDDVALPPHGSYPITIRHMTGSNLLERWGRELVAGSRIAGYRTSDMQSSYSKHVPFDA